MTKVKSHQTKTQLVTKTTVRRPGSMRGKIRIKKNFDAPLPKELLHAFNGRR
jgi:hypothetical protein